MLHCRSQKTWLRMGLEESLEGLFGEADLGDTVRGDCYSHSGRRPELARAG
jgi:hypothetical protein